MNQKMIVKLLNSSLILGRHINVKYRGKKLREFNMSRFFANYSLFMREISKMNRISTKTFMQLLHNSLQTKIKTLLKFWEGKKQVFNLHSIISFTYSNACTLLTKIAESASIRHPCTSASCRVLLGFSVKNIITKFSNYASPVHRRKNLKNYAKNRIHVFSSIRVLHSLWVLG